MTTDYGPAYRRVARELHREIESGVYPPGSELPTESALMEQHGLSRTTVRDGLGLLAAAGLIDGGSGRTRTVRKPLPRIRRDGTERYQHEKDMVASGGLPSDSHLAREMGFPDDQTDVKLLGDGPVTDDEIAALMGLDPDALLYRYTFLLGVEGPGRIAHHYYPKLLDDLVRSAVENRMHNAPWPGGTMYQLARLNVEIASVQDVVTTRMPFPTEVELLGMPEGVSLLIVRKISRDTQGFVREVADVLMPGDRTELSYLMRLEPWIGGPRTVWPAGPSTDADSDAEG